MWKNNWRGEPCKANWTNGALRIEIRPEIRMIVILGRVQKKNDGRWEWFFIEDSNGFFQTDQPAKVQGVAATEQKAKGIIEKIWGLKEIENECAN